MAEAAPTTRDRLLQAARELFTAEGFHGTTTPLISSRAGVAEGTIYRHFPSKQALLNAVFQDAQQWGIATIREAASQGGRVGDRLGALARTWLDTAAERPALMRMLLSWRTEQELDEESLQAMRAFRTELEQLVAQGKQQGSIRAGVVELWTLVWLTLVVVAVDRVASGEWSVRHPHTLATIDAAWEAIAWRPIAAPPPQAEPTTAGN